MRWNPVHGFIEQIIHVFEDNRNQEQAVQMKRYMRDQFAFLGIKAPLRRKLSKPFLTQSGLPGAPGPGEIVMHLWHLPEREYQLLAVDLLAKMKRTLDERHMPLLERLLVTKSWWDTVDLLAAQIIGHVFLKHPELVPKYADRWLESDNVWLIRSAILFQLHYKSQTDEERLFRSVLMHADSEHFFIQKAGGWALREYSKTAPKAVIHFIETNELKPLCRREGLKWLSRPEQK